MTTESPWDSTRWRAGQHQGRYEGHQLPRRSAVDPTSQNITLDSSYMQTWYGKSRADIDHQVQTRELPPLMDPYTDASNFRSRLHERHSPSMSGDSNGPQKLNNFSVTNSAWQNVPLDDPRTNERPITDPPLTLQIPKTQDLPTISSGYSAQVHESQSYNYNSHTPRPQSHQTTSLPSFASFQEHANRIDDAEEVEIAPMSARLSCYLCTKLKPLVRDVAIAVAEIDENVQSYCNMSVTRTLDFPKDSPVRTVQWILDRLKYAQGDLQVAAHRMQTNNFYQHKAVSNNSPPETLKRSADGWDQDELPAAKRRRSGASPDDVQQAMSSSIRDERRGSLDFIQRDQMSRAGFSPPPTDSVPGSAYPRTGSPVLPGRPLRALPSPSSLAYPPSAAPSLAHLAGQSVGSPAMSYQPTVSIHTASTNSATSAHLADLQHQVTLKSLALQTLQSEYASLLQKLQRERVKSQTIEKKTNVADQEVNELTNRNEDLRDQVRNLEVQLEESETKREAERADFAKEKDQWGRMLELGGRLQAKSGDDIQKLKDEKAGLLQRVAAYEQGAPVRQDRVQRDDSASRIEPSRQDPGNSQRKIDQDTNSATIEGPTIGPHSGFVGHTLNDVESLNREIAILKSRNDVLRFSLEETRRHNQRLDERVKEVVQRSGEIGGVIDRALDEEQSAGEGQNVETKRDQKGRNGGPIIAPRRSTSSQKPFPSAYPIFSKVPHSTEQQGVAQSAESSTSVATMASIARAVSPGPEELGFHVTPSTSSPQELINLLGPVPAPSFTTTFEAKSSTAPLEGPRRVDKREGGKQRWKQSDQQMSPWTPLNLSHQSEMKDGCNIGGFRPLSHDLPSPYTPVAQPPTHTGTPSHSHYTSPQPVMQDLSSNSSGSAKSRSPETSQHQQDSSSQTNDQLAPNPPDASSTMPPPPRPSLPSPYTGALDSTSSASSSRA